MPSFAELNIFNQIIQLPELKVKDYHFIEGFGLVLVVEKKEKKAPCPRCGKKSDRLHQNHEYLVRDLPHAEHQVYLKVNRRQLKCTRCKKPFSEKFDFVDKTRTYTSRLAQKVIREVIESDIKNVAERNGLSENEVATILKEKFSDLKTDKPTGLKKLGIDEIAYVKGHKNYCAVLVDLETRRTIDILEKRTQECLRECFERWGPEILDGIEEVSIDLWSAYKNLVKELMPNAEVVADRFHVMKLVNEELDPERKSVKRTIKKVKKKAERERLTKVITNSKYCLLKNEKDLNDEPREKLEEVKKVFPELADMHRLKESLRKTFENSNSEVIGLLNLADWWRDAASKFPSSCATIIRWFGEIIPDFKNRTTQGVVEGINNKLKLIKRKGFGFRNFNNFRLRSLLSFHFNT